MTERFPYRKNLQSTPLTLFAKNECPKKGVENTKFNWELKIGFFGSWVSREKTIVSILKII
jgi:hypothetical protein